MKAYPDTFAIVDTETTGMRPGFARVMDIGIIRVENGQVTERFQSLINPGMSVPPFIAGFTGINDADLESAPGFDEIALEVERLLRGAVFVAHNAPFDYGFMKAEFARIGMVWSAETLCTVKLSRALFPHESSHSLDAIIERHGIDISDRHRALPDAEAVYEFLKKASVMVGDRQLARAVDAVRSGSLPGVGRDTFKQLPDKAGVYFFYGPEQELLYIGKSKNVRTRARSHFTSGGMSMDSRVNNEVASIDSITTSGELSALLLESSLVKKESPAYNRMLRKKRALVVAKKVKNKEGYDAVSLEKASDISPDGSILAVFRTTTQGKSVLRALAKEYQLCERLLGIESGKGACFARQLGNCDGACVGALPSSDYNLRLAEAFKKRRVRVWPYSGPILVTEQESEHAGTVFFIDEWVLYAAYKYDDENYQSLIDGQESFEYDTYKILARYLRKKENQRFVKHVTKSEFRQMLARCVGDVESSIE